MFKNLDLTKFHTCTPYIEQKLGGWGVCLDQIVSFTFTTECSI